MKLKSYGFLAHSRNATVEIMANWFWIGSPFRPYAPTPAGAGYLVSRFWPRTSPTQIGQPETGLL